MATTSSRSIEITVISGEDLRIDRKSVKRKTFVTVKFDRQSIGGGGGGRTEIDERGGCYPFWNEKMLMEIPVDAMFLTIEVHCGSISRNRIVGTANVPVSDFLGRCSAGQTEFFTRLGRLLKEKAKSDVEKVFFGFSKTRDNLAVIYEFLLYWNLPEIDRVLDELEETRDNLAVIDELLLYLNLAEIDGVLDELEEALFVSDFGQRIAPLRSWRACVTTSAGKGNETDLQLGFRCAFFIA
ncbi:cell division protein FtsY homolog, chloroplastic-like isoform X2 [Cucurbita maxima]|uniref:Cell division protein FtsY homolog, chloroplastic-like isoform X2 n=1 Tax=Cucurbita maxima TaxID=3661 RepID=A0A6J1IR79_CUCMA|nr:cell division protein FtsY homolog, chloroplastic-like isoform X2 [Cucurbita maxima]